MTTNTGKLMTGVILAGGQGSRMGGLDKGLLVLQGRPLVEHLLDALQPQVDAILISANRNQARYQQYQHPVISDELTGYQGPLAGFAAAMQFATTPYVLIVPCDAPVMAPDTAARLWQALQRESAELAVAHDGERLQPVHALIPVSLLPSLRVFLANGDRKIDLWYAQHRVAVVDFSDYRAMFRNINTPAQQAAMEQMPLNAPATDKRITEIPLLGLCAWSGAGKTTLMTHLIKHLKAAGLQITVIKHGHHQIELDTPGKDTYRFREAGADQVLLASRKRIAIMQECKTQREPELADVLRFINCDCADLVLVEGFKHTTIPKIEVHRPSVGKPLLYPDDSSVLAVATDDLTLDLPTHLAKLDLNQPDTVAAFILQWLKKAQRMTRGSTMLVTETPTQKAIALIPVTAANWQSISDALPAMAQQWAQLNGFSAKAGQICVVPNQAGGIHCVLAAYDASEGYEWSLAGLPDKLPAGNYHLQTDWTVEQRTAAAIGWGLGCYRFDTFKSAPGKALPHLFADADQARVDAFVQAISLVRDLINAPANHMMPEDLSLAAQRLASTYGASFREVVGEALLEENYPAIYAVGRASSHAPRLLELHWGNPQHPRIALVGKGVCFDTGGLDLKPSQHMRLMQKDMGGAAHALGLAQLIMATGLPVQLHVLIPAVENAVGGDAFRPGDILSTRAGKSVEVDNTDAEGRLVLCDAFTAAVEQQPELLLDFATLTGAARVALGTEIPVFFCNDKALTGALQAASEAANELIWNLPLHKPYFAELKSQFADVQNSGGSYGGAITAALFLNEFVPENLPWAHFDMMAWNTRARAGRPIGGEAMGLLAVYRYFEINYRSYP